MQNQTHFIHTPPGSKPLYKEEAIFRNNIQKKMTDFFELWSYFPVETPIIDYFDIYAPFLSERQKKGSFRFINRDGDLIVLRNDLTLFAAKSLAARGNGIEETLRYHYNGQIIRCHTKDSPEEYYQMGCEITSPSFTKEEVEILSILIESANYIGIKDYLVHIGDISLFTPLFKGLDESDIKELLSFIRVRNKYAIKNKLSSLSVSQEIKNDIITLSGFIGSLEEFESLKLSNTAKQGILPLLTLARDLKKLNYNNAIVIDPSELSELDYYNGIIFHLYAKGAETPLASGGRYDRLFEKLGSPRHAVGFSYWLYPIEKLLSSEDFTNKQGQDIVIKPEQFTEDFSKAIEEVRKGKKINLKY